MWSLIQFLFYDLPYYIYKTADDFKWQSLIMFVVYSIGKLSGMRLFRNYLEGHFPYLKSEESEWKLWVNKEIEGLNGGRFIPKKVYRGAGRLKKLQAKNYDTFSTLSPQDTNQEGKRMDKILIATDDGHGIDTAGKRTPVFEDGSFMKENEFNRVVIDKLNNHLKRNDFDVLHVSAGDSDVPLNTRTGLANNTIPNGFNRPANVIVSVHANALGNAWNSKAKGIEIFYRAGYKEGKRLAQDIQSFLIGGTPLINRGLKTANLHITREAAMPGVLIEGAFMDNPDEAILLKSDAYRSECAEEIARGLCKYFDRPYIEVSPLIKTPAGTYPVFIVLGENQYNGLIIDNKSWLPVKETFAAMNFTNWTFKSKSIFVNGTQLETKILSNTSFIKATDLKSIGLLKNVFLDPDAINTKRVLLIPLEVLVNE